MTKYARFSNHEGIINYGIVSEDVVEVIDGSPVNHGEKTGERYPLQEVKLLAPIVPNQIIGIGLNYIAPGESMPDPKPAMPTFFFKPVSSVVGPEDEIRIPPDLQEVKFEAEIAVVIGKPAFQVSEAEALDYVFGYTVANDVTAIQYFHPNGNWTLSKVFPTFTPLGPYLVTGLNPAELYVKSKQNQQWKQNSPTTLMIESIASMISYLSKLTPLAPNDVILTGAPAGADWFRRGDTIECIVDEIGVLRNRAAD